MSRTPGAVLAAVATGLAVLAPIVGGTGPADTGVVELRDELATGAAFVDAVTLAEWIRDGRDVRIWDVRPDSGAHVRFSIPTASHVSYRSLVDRAVDPGTVVVYDDGRGESVRSWLLLRRLGHPDVRILRGGVPGWVEGVLRPVLPAGTPDERRRYQRVAAVSRYFGGLPRIGRPPPAGSEEAVRLVTRRGCY